jgi:predicted MFS family arabinose efflux permease
VAALSEAAASGLVGPAPAALLATSLAFAALVVRRERRVERPLVPRELLRSPGLVAANVAGLLHGAMMLAAFLLLTLHMQSVLGMSPIAAGAGLLAARATSVLVAPAAARMAPIVGPRRLMVAGMAAMTAGLLVLARAPADGAYAADLLPGLLMLGVAIPVLFLTINLVALAAAPAGSTGMASGLLNTSQWVGGALGAAGAGAMAGGAAPGAIQAGLWACAALGVAGTLLALAMARGSRRAAPTPAPAAA